MNLLYSIVDAEDRYSIEDLDTKEMDEHLMEAKNHGIDWVSEVKTIQLSKKINVFSYC